MERNDHENPLVPHPQEATPGSISLMGGYLLVLVVALVYMLAKLWPRPLLDAQGKMILDTQNKPIWVTTVRVLWRFTWDVHSEVRLILLVMVVGALGSYVHAATSFADYVGNRRFVTSWSWWYILRPFIGMALALIFYFAIRGGLLSAGAGAGDISPFGVAAVAGLVGMFSKQATDKLREQFDTLFRTETGDQRTDKLEHPTPRITTIEPSNVQAGRDIQMDEKAVTPDPEDDESHIDGCDVSIEDATSDEDLPATEGGVA